MTDAAFAGLVDAICAVVAAEGRDAAARTARALADGGRRHVAAPQRPTEFDQRIRAILAGSTHPAAGAILAAQDLVGWGVNPVADRMTGQAASICAIATLMGPEGPVRSPCFRLGLFYQGRDSYYPLHNHDADETYVILAGSAIWTAGHDTRLRLAGDSIHHPSRMPHAFRTGGEGFLALWRWSGDINTHSYAFLPDPAA